MKIKQRKLITYSSYTLMAIFACLLGYTLYKEFDPILMILGLFFIGSGLVAIDGNDHFGDVLEDTKERVRQIENMKL